MIYRNSATLHDINKTLHTEYKLANMDATTGNTHPEASPEGPALERFRELAGRRNTCTLVKHGLATRPSQRLKHIRPLCGKPCLKMPDLHNTPYIIYLPYSTNSLTTRLSGPTYLSIRLCTQQIRHAPLPRNVETRITECTALPPQQKVNPTRAFPYRKSLELLAELTIPDTFPCTSHNPPPYLK